MVSNYGMYVAIVDNTQVLPTVLVCLYSVY
jgi:hypothetical protein